MVFSKALYVGKGIKNLWKIKYKLRTKKYLGGIYLIRIAENGYDNLEIIPANYFLQPITAYEKNQIVGIASSHEEAVALVENMLQDCLAKTGDVNLRAYLWKQNQARNGEWL